MRMLLHDDNGNTTLLSVFIAFLLISLSIIVYSGSTIYSKYRSAQTELERAISVAVDRGMENRNVRDLELNIPVEPVLAGLKANLFSAGWVQIDGETWSKYNDGQMVYELRNIVIDVHEDWIEISGLFVMPLPWGINEQTEFEIPISTRSKVLYLD